ncbi:MAG: cytochrome c [Marinobacterium sp.]|nr:cytochrome c [Marinobacterium sp.]
MKVVTFTLILSLAGLTGCGEAETPPPASASGQQLFDHHCAGCHRPQGTGNFLKGIPANALTDMDVDDIVSLIRNGDVSKPKMPAFPELSRYQAERIVLHMWQLRKELIERYNQQ